MIPYLELCDKNANAILDRAVNVPMEGVSVLLRVDGTPSDVLFMIPTGDDGFFLVVYHDEDDRPWVAEVRRDRVTVRDPDGTVLNWNEFLGDADLERVEIAVFTVDGDDFVG